MQETELGGWLSLTRRRGEQILIGDDIIIEVARIDKQRVQLAIRAPKELVILRGELIRDESCRGEDG